MPFSFVLESCFRLWLVGWFAFDALHTKHMFSPTGWLRDAEEQAREREREYQCVCACAREKE